MDSFIVSKHSKPSENTRSLGSANIDNQYWKSMCVHRPSLNSSKYALSLLSEDLEQYLNKLVPAHGNSLPDLASVEDWVDDISKWGDMPAFHPL